MAVKQVADGYAIQLTANKPAKNIYLNSTMDVHFGSNFFDLSAGEEKVAL